MDYNPHIDIIIIGCGGIVLFGYAAIASYFENKRKKKE